MYWFELVQSSEPLISSMISLIMTQSTDTAFNSYFHVSTPYSLDFINVLINLLSMQVRNVKVCQDSGVVKAFDLLIDDLPKQFLWVREIVSIGWHRICF